MCPCFAELYSPNLTTGKTTVMANTPVLWLQPVREVLWFAEVLHICQTTERKGNAEDLLSLPSHLPNALFSFNLKVKLLETCLSPASSPEALAQIPNTHGVGKDDCRARLWIPSSRAPHSPGVARTKGWHRTDLLRVPSNQMGAAGCLQHSLNTEKINTLQAEHSKGRELSVSAPNAFQTNPDVPILLY